MRVTYNFVNQTVMNNFIVPLISMSCTISFVCAFVVGEKDLKITKNDMFEEQLTKFLIASLKL